jgi:hypothetical protein
MPCSVRNLERLSPSETGPQLPNSAPFSVQKTSETDQI